MKRLKRIDDLLTPAERERLYADLAEMARRRRAAEAASRHTVLH